MQRARANERCVCRIHGYTRVRSHGCGCTRCCGRKWKLSAPLPSIAPGERERRPPILRCIRAGARASELPREFSRVASRASAGCDSRSEAALHASNSALRVLRHPAKYACDRRALACPQDAAIRISLVAAPSGAFNRAHARRYVTFHNG